MQAVIDTNKTLGEVLDLLEAEFFKPEVKREGLGIPRIEVNFERNGLRFELDIKEIEE